MATTLTIRRGASSFMADDGSSIVLKDGELFAEYQSDGTVKLKIGDGSTLYSQLPYISTADYPERPKTRYEILVSNWSEDVDENEYYTYNLTLDPELNMSYPPNIYLAGSDDETVYTSTEKEQYSTLEYCNLTSESTLVLYSKKKPTENFYIFIEGDIKK